MSTSSIPQGGKGLASLEMYSSCVDFGLGYDVCVLFRVCEPSDMLVALRGFVGRFC